MAEDKKPLLSEFQGSLLRPVQTDAAYRRVVATVDDALAFHRGFTPPVDYRPELVPLRFDRIELAVSTTALLKMHAWVALRSEDFTLEVQGRFLAKRQRDHVLVDEFVPLPSFCQSLAYETASPDERKERFGEARMRTISVDDWKPHATAVYQTLGIFSGADRIEIDPFKLAIPFHSHYLKSSYQHGPSPGDSDGIFHLKWLYAPLSGKNIVYSGVTELVRELPFVFAPVALRASGSPTPTNPEDCRITIHSGMLAGCEYPLAAGTELSLGRSASCDISLDDPNVSRHHARLFFDGAGNLVVEDLRSAYGVLIDDRVHLRGQQQLLDHPCQLRLSPATLLAVTF